MLILDLWNISFHAVVVFGLGMDLLFKSVLGHCVWALLGSPPLTTSLGLARLQPLFFRVFARTARSRKYYRRSESETQRNAA